MKRTFPILIISIALAWSARAQSPSPAASAAAGSSTAAAGNTDIYHVHFAKSAVGKAAAHGDMLKKQDPGAPMPGHFVVFRHENGDSWDYCVIEHLGTKATLDMAKPPATPAVQGLGEWHNDTYASGPAWATFAKEMGLDDASKTGASAYVVSMYRPAGDQRDALGKYLNEPPDRATDSTSGNIVLQHMEGAAWTFVKIARNNSWDDF
ncbi:MAG: hypothetical protein ACJ8KX_06890, partial [Chthoniobacterales bacterium]